MADIPLDFLFSICTFSKSVRLLKLLTVPLMLLMLANQMKNCYCSTCSASITNSNAIISNEITYPGSSQILSHGVLLGPISKGLYTLHTVNNYISINISLILSNTI